MIKMGHLKILAHKYAIAFFNVFGGEQTNFYPEIKTILSWLDERTLFFHLLQVNNLSIPEKEVMLSKMNEALNLSEPLVNILSVLLARKEIGLMPLVLKAIGKEELIRNNMHKVKITSAQELTEEQQKQILTSLEEKIDGSLLPSFEIDPSLIAGFKVKGDLFSWEESVAKKIRTLKQHLMEHEAL